MSPSLHAHFRQSGFMRLLLLLTRIRSVKFGSRCCFVPTRYCYHACHLQDKRYSFRRIPFLFPTLDNPNIRQPFLRYLLCRLLDLHFFPKRAGVTKTAPSHQRNPPSNNLIRKFRKSGVLTGLAPRIYARGKNMVTLSALTKSSLPLPT